MKRKIRNILIAVSIMGWGLSTGALAGEPPQVPYVFGMYCLMCHKENVQIGPIGIFDMKTKEGNALHPEYVRNNTRFGYKAMPAFRLSEVSAKEMEEIVTYLKDLADYRKEHPDYQPAID